jgi:8-amino-7-oxononanoate synthase
MTILEDLNKCLLKRQRIGNYRTLRMESPLIDFASNDYLGLSRSQSLRQAVLNEWETWNDRGVRNGLGSTGSRLLTGNLSYIEKLEHQIASFHGFEAGLLFSCGYMANAGVLSCLASSNDRIFYDTHIHASTCDGIRLSRAAAYPFRHNDVGHLDNRLKHSSASGKRLVCIQSVYADGSLAPLEKLSSLCIDYGADLIVDEAHAVGVFGYHGEGLTSERKVTGSIFAQITTFGKGLGVYGAVVLGSSILREYLINFSKMFVYTTALPFPALAAIKCAYEMLPGLKKERSHLIHLVNHFRKTFKSNCAAPIQPISVAGNAGGLRFSQFLASRGFDVRPILSPTVQKGHECLRVCLHAFNTECEVNRLIDLITKYKK